MLKGLLYAENRKAINRKKKKRKEKKREWMKEKYHQCSESSRKAISKASVMIKG